MPENGFPVIRVDQFQVDADQVLVGRKEIQTLHFGLADGVGDLFAIQQDIVESVHALGFLDTEAAGGVSLRVAVDYENLHFARRQGCGEVNGGGGLPHPTFLICDRYDSGQRI